VNINEILKMNINEILKTAMRPSYSANRNISFNALKKFISTAKTQINKISSRNTKKMFSLACG